MRAVFVCTPSKAYGEVNSAIPLAQGIVNQGGEVWFIASPLAAQVASPAFPDRVFTLTGDREFNQSLFWRVCRKFRPNVIVFVEFYEILRPRRKPDCPLIDRRWIRRIDSIPSELVFLDFIAHVPMLRDIAGCKICSRRFGAPWLRAFLRRVRVMLPCPLNEPGRVKGRCGVPYRTSSLPLDLDPRERKEARARFVRGDDEDELLVLRTGATWQSVLAQKYGVRLYEYLSDLLAFYFGATRRRVSLLSISSHHKLLPGIAGLRIVNVENLPPAEFNRLVLSCDLVITDNEIGYVLAKTIGRVPGLVFVNSFIADEVLGRERHGSLVANVVEQLESYRCGAVYPHKIFPLPAGPEQFVESVPPAREDHAHVPHGSNLRLGRMVSSPFMKAEIYGGEETRSRITELLCDAAPGQWFTREDASYIRRLETLRLGAEVLTNLLRREPSPVDTVL